MIEQQISFKLASILFEYPDPAWFETEELLFEINQLQNRTVQDAYLRFLSWFQTSDYETVCETYVRTFDLNEKTTLYLTYGVFGDNPERGAAFLKLKEEFAAAGFPLEEDELPDYLPLILEFAAIAPMEVAQNMLVIHKQTIDRLLQELEAAENPYRWILQGCVAAIDEFKSPVQTRLEEAHEPA